MLRSTTHRLLLYALMLGSVLATVIGVAAGGALAHNALVSSNPADGATLSVAPTEIVWVFDKSVPLDTLTVTLIDAAGVRSELAGSVHGATGDTEVVTPLPTVGPGALSLRWRLVGADGHPVTGRVDITVEASGIGASPDPTNTIAADVIADSPAANPTGDQTRAAAGDDGGDGASSTPSVVRWLLRYASYLAVMAAVGILLTNAFVWHEAVSHPLLRRILSGSLLATAVLGLLQLLVIGSDISAASWWSSFGSIDAAMTTDAGMAFAVRIVIAIAAWLVLFQYRIDTPMSPITLRRLPGSPGSPSSAGS